jgi:hypothetical protein
VAKFQPWVATPLEKLRMSLKSFLRTVLLAQALLLGTGSANAEVQVWTWQGSGNFPRTVSLEILQDAQGHDVVILNDWGALQSVGGWGELQRTHTMTAGVIRRIGDRAFIVLAEQQQCAEFVIAPDGNLRLRWFSLQTASPSDSDLLAKTSRARGSDWPTEMRPAGADGAGPSQPLPL